MKFAAALAFADPSQFLAVARTADQCGWDALALSDHVFFPETMNSAYPYVATGKPFWEQAAPWPDVWVTIGALAAVTTRLAFLTNVYVLPARHPLHVAKAVSTAAVLSDNRVILGIGIGWMREEFDVLGHDFSTRGQRADEAIVVLRTVWRGGMVEYHGQFYSFERLLMSPAPTRPVPIWVGGESNPALRRAARLGDGFISVLHSQAEIVALVERLNALRAEYGRANAPFDFCVSCHDANTLDDIRRLQDAGVTTLLTVPWLLYGDDPTLLDSKRRGLERFGDDIIAKMR
ncbi:MAG: TIGR03619 family F420-dependent LLM class oxidoreductase [Deltaproteobacteria bacterium]|nr:TIGR03619 family F420-dependent LLM class oxidoreductase [Deltaproteobacteria bacterium]